MLKKITRIAVLASLPLFFVACGGGSSDSVESYAGHYQGTLAGSPGHEKNAGKLEFTISSTGKLTGTANVNIYPQILDGLSSIWCKWWIIGHARQSNNKSWA